MSNADQLARALRTLLNNPAAREQAEHALAAYDAAQDRAERYRHLHGRASETSAARQ
jgi:cell fate (sporulation/competence/biofilm development) regulator YlbF (YheA/YmcA/DUF963 family)